MVNEMGMSNTEYKDKLRQDLINIERYTKLINEGKIQEALEELERDAKRINASLQD